MRESDGPPADAPLSLRVSHATSVPAPGSMAQRPGGGDAAPASVGPLPASAAPGGAADPFAGPGEMRARARALDWAATSLGPVAAWSPALRTVVRTSLESPFPINLWCGPELLLIYNDAYADVLGDKHPGALGRPGAEVWAEIWPQIAPMFPAIAAGGAPVYAEDAPFVVRRAGADHTGEGPNAWFTFALSAVRDDDGAVVAYLNVVSETTGRVRAERAREAARAEARRAEARLLGVFEKAPSFMVLLRGPEHVVEYANAAYYRLVGHRSLVGRPLFDALTEVRGQGYEALLARVLETGETFVGREMPALVSDVPGAEPVQRYLDLVYYPIDEADGTRSGVVAHGNDVTEHVLARREAQRARGQAEEANQAKSHFLAMMSHEIRTPINAVLGYTDLLDLGVAGPLSPQQQEYVTRVRVSSRHLLGLVNDVLDLSKIEAGEMTVAADEVAAGDVLARVMEIMEAQAGPRGIDLRQAWDCPPSTRFTGDADRVRQIVLNLVANALKFTPAGGAVTLRCRTADEASADVVAEGAAWVVVDVDDTGRGIAPEKLGRIFEPFGQAEAEDARGRDGTGLGLTISRRFARMMGGDLTVESTPGAGSRFSLWLPHARDASPDAD
jgi:signal transduction histidine kinase